MFSAKVKIANSIPDTNIVIDYWDFKTTRLRDYLIRFMTSISNHSERNVELIQKADYTIYTSLFNKWYLCQFYDISKNRIKVLPFNKTVEITDPLNKVKFNVTAIEANYCSGSSMFLFQGPFGNILYTGYFRTAVAARIYDTPVLKAVIEQQNLHKAYIDNSYAAEHCNFPHRWEVIRQIVELIRCRSSKIVISSKKLGKEEVFLAIASELSEQIGVSQRRFCILQRIGVGDFFTSDFKSARIRVVDHLLSFKECCTMFEKNDTCEIILLTALYKYGPKKFPFKLKFPRLHIIPYSGHCNHSELKQFVAKVKPHEILPIVKAGAHHLCSKIPESIYNLCNREVEESDNDNLKSSEKPTSPRTRSDLVATESSFQRQPDREDFIFPDIENIVIPEAKGEFSNDECDSLKPQESTENAGVFIAEKTMPSPEFESEESVVHELVVNDKSVDISLGLSKEEKTKERIKFVCSKSSLYNLNHPVNFDEVPASIPGIKLPKRQKLFFDIRKSSNNIFSNVLYDDFSTLRNILPPSKVSIRRCNKIMKPSVSKIDLSNERKTIWVSLVPTKSTNSFGKSSSADDTNNFHSNGSNDLISVLNRNVTSLGRDEHSVNNFENDSHITDENRGNINKKSVDKDEIIELNETDGHFRRFSREYSSNDLRKCENVSVDLDLDHVILVENANQKIILPEVINDSPSIVGNDSISVLDRNITLCASDEHSTCTSTQNETKTNIFEKNFGSTEPNCVNDQETLEVNRGDNHLSQECSSYDRKRENFLDDLDSSRLTVAENMNQKIVSTEITDDSPQINSNDSISILNRNIMLSESDEHSSNISTHDVSETNVFKENFRITKTNSSSNRVGVQLNENNGYLSQEYPRKDLQKIENVSDDSDSDCVIIEEKVNQIIVIGDSSPIDSSDSISLLNRNVTLSESDTGSANISAQNKIDSNILDENVGNTNSNLVNDYEIMNFNQGYRHLSSEFPPNNLRTSENDVDSSDSDCVIVAEYIHPKINPTKHVKNRYHFVSPVPKKRRLNPVDDDASDQKSDLSIHAILFHYSKFYNCDKCNIDIDQWNFLTNSHIFSHPAYQKD